MPLRPNGRSGIALVLVLRRVYQNVALTGARGWRQGFALDAGDLVTGLGILVLTRFGCRSTRLQRFAHDKSPINELLLH